MGSRYGPTTRVFTAAGVVAHLLDSLSSPNSNTPAICGRWPGSFWFGTGSQVETDMAAKLRTCKRCAKKVAPDV